MACWQPWRLMQCCTTALMGAAPWMPSCLQSCWTVWRLAWRSSRLQCFQSWQRPLALQSWPGSLPVVPAWLRCAESWLTWRLTSLLGLPGCRLALHALSVPLAGRGTALGLQELQGQEL